MTDEAGWLRPAFDDLERAEIASLAHLMQRPPDTRRSDHALRSVLATAGAFGLVLGTSVLLGRL
jgi:hypothetical protein